MCSNDQYEKICKDEFSKLHLKLDKLDEAIRGNGKPGIQTRLDRLEQDRLTRGRFFWFLMGCIGTSATSILVIILTR